MLIVARFTKAFDEPIDGILYCTASAVGFSCIEEYGYLFYGRMHASLLVLRATSTPPAHIFFTAITGYALGQGIGKGWRAIPIGVLGFLGSIVVHGLYDAIISFSALQIVSRIYLVLLLVLFTYLVRRSLRGSKGKVAPAPGATVVRVGSWLGMTLTTAVVALGTLLLRELALRSSPESTYATGTTITFTPEADYVGTAQFDYTVSDGALTDVGRVTITVTPVNDPPVAIDDSATTAEDTPLVLAAATLAANDTGSDRDCAITPSPGWRSRGRADPPPPRVARGAADHRCS